MNKVFKKLTAVGLAALLGVGTMSMMLVSAEETGTETETTPVYDVELLENGGFETLDENGFPEGWTKTLDENAKGTIEADETAGATGKYAMKLVADNASTTDAENESLLSSRIYHRFQYTKYAHSMTVITGRIRIEGLEGDSYVQIECATPSFGITNHMDAEILFKDDTDWVSFETSVNELKDKEAGTAVFFVRLYGKGTVYVDDLSIKDKEGRLLPSIMEKMSYKTQKGTPNVTHGYILDDVPEEAKAVTPYSPDNCFYAWTTTDDTDVRAYYIFPTRNKPQAGVNYRLSLRFKPKTEEADYNGPRFDIMTGDAISSNPTIRFNPNCWTVENVDKNGWRELSVYFTMLDFTGSNVYLMMRGVYGGWVDDLMLERDYNEGAEFLDTNFVNITSAKVGDKIKVKVHALSEKTESDGGEKVAILLAQYDKTSETLQCVDVQVAEKTINKDTVVKVTDDNTRTRKQSAEDFVIDYTIPSSAAGCTLKAFFWQGASGLTPLGDACAITVSEASES